MVATATRTSYGRPGAARNDRREFAWKKCCHGVEGQRAGGGTLAAASALLVNAAGCGSDADPEAESAQASPWRRRRTFPTWLPTSCRSRTASPPKAANSELGGEMVTLSMVKENEPSVTVAIIADNDNQPADMTVTVTDVGG